MSEQLTRIAVLQNLEPVLQQFGLDAGEELAALDLDLDMLRDGELLINVRTVAAVLEHCARVTACPDFSLRLAAAQDMSLLGVLALFLQTSSTLGEALQEICQYNHLAHAQSVTWRLEPQGEKIMFSFNLDAENLTPLQHRSVVDLGLGHGYRAIETLTEGRVKPVRVLLRCDRSGEQQNYRRFFKAPVAFNAEADGLVLSAASLDMPLVHPDSKMHEAVRTQIPSIESEGEGLAHEVRTIIRALLPTGNSRLERVAQCYACDRRTLQRYLREEANTNYQALLDEVRFELVQQYLRDSHMPMTQITYVAGFSDPSNFSRAFRKRFGLAPKEWRAMHQSTTLPARSRRLGLRVSVA